MANAKKSDALLEPVLQTPSLRLVCHEGEFEELLAELALHRLDLVLAGQPAPRNPNLRLTNERLIHEWTGSSGADPLTFRWQQAKVLLRDISVGRTGHAGA